MRPFLVASLAALALLHVPTSLFAAEPSPTADSVLWKFDSLKTIGGHEITVLGEPRLIEVGKERAMEFDGQDDAVFIPVHPLAGLRQFTAEVIFRPDGDGPAEQRFFHMQEKGSEDRTLFETRVANGQWYLDTYILSGHGSYTQMDKKFSHPADRWYHAALVVEGDEMRHYVNGKLEITTKINYTPPQAGQTSVGVRQNKVHWFKGAVRTARFTPRPLKPEQFLKP